MPRGKRLLSENNNNKVLNKKPKKTSRKLKSKSINNSSSNDVSMNSESKINSDMDTEYMSNSSSSSKKEPLHVTFWNESKKHTHSNTKKVDFNKLLIDYLKDKDYFDPKNLNQKNIDKSMKDYEKSFDDIHSFKKNFTKRDIDNINTIMYHDENNDGMIACAIAYHYFKDNNKDKFIKLIPIKPGKNYDYYKLLDSNTHLLIVDIENKEHILQMIQKICSSLIIIDDHYATLHDDHIFNGNNHSASAYTWKFFYPKLDVPTVIQFIDNDDAKLFLKHIPKGYSHFIAHSIGFRYTHNKLPQTMIKKKDGRLFDELWHIINESVPSFWITLGFYYDEVTDNLKEQIATNAVLRKFQGYNVGVLNFNSPALSKPVCRQIITNFKKKGIQIDFVVLWGYEYTSNGYRVQLMDDHSQFAKIDLSQIARKLGEIGKHEKRGGGHFHDGNFYWPRRDNMDIWSLFEKQYI